MPKGQIRSREQRVDRIRENALGNPILSRGEEPLFILQNDYWVIRYQRHVALLKSTRGLRYLAVLLGAPGHEFHVRDLLAHVMGSSATAAPVIVHERFTARLDAGVPLLDAQAKAEYKRRLKELRQDLKEAERFNDLQRQIETQNEIQAITNYLAAVVGLGGRDRRASSDAERARSAVTKCIKKAIQKIGDSLPSLGYHLATRIKTGYFCCYNPHPERPVNWKL